MQIVVKNRQELERFFRKLEREIDRGWLRLFRQIGPGLRQDVKNRIISEDGGSWESVSKWVRAKKNARKALSGTWKRVKTRTITGVGGGKLFLFFESPGDWTLTQHHDGFVNQPTGRRVNIPIVNPRPLNLKAGTSSFSFVDRNSSKVPTRKIWPSENEAIGIIQPKVAPWFVDIINRTKAKL